MIFPTSRFLKVHFTEHLLLIVKKTKKTVSVPLHKGRDGKHRDVCINPNIPVHVMYLYTHFLDVRIPL